MFICKQNGSITINLAYVDDLIITDNKLDLILDIKTNLKINLKSKI